MKLSDGQIITLDDEKDYVVLKQKMYKSNNYVYLMTLKKPIEIMFVRQGNNELNLVIDDNELETVMNLFLN